MFDRIHFVLFIFNWFYIENLLKFIGFYWILLVFIDQLTT